MFKERDNICTIVNNGMCISCMTCKSVCPVSAVSVIYNQDQGMFLPVIDSILCKKCGICHHLCPSSDLPREMVTKKSVKRENVQDTFACYCLDEKVRWNSTSGGFVSCLVLRLLSLGFYKKAYVVEFDNFVGDQARSCSQNKYDNILASAKSKYIPVSIEDIIIAVKDNSIESAIIVCTPCQLRAIKNAFSYYKRDCGSVLFVGLFCERMFNYRIYGHYRENYGEYQKLFFREKEPNGWPGDTTLVRCNERVKVDRSVRMALKPIYSVKRCDFCEDKLCGDADLSVGDCYISRCSNMDGDWRGVNSVIVRTIKGKKVFDKCKSDFIIASCSLTEIEKAQGVYKTSILVRLIMMPFRILRYVVKIVVKGLM